MLKRVELKIAVSLALCLPLCGAGAVNAQNLLVKGGTLIDGTGAAPIPDAHVLIVDGIIQKVWSGEAGSPALTRGTKVIDAAGKFLIPGLIESHIHYAWYMGEMFLSHGVTSVFDLGGGHWSAALKKSVNAGLIRAPRYYHHETLGDGGNGKTDPLAGSGTAKMRVWANVDTPNDAAKAVAALKGKADIITLDEDWKGDYFAAVAKAAHAQGLSIISHSFNALNTSDWGVDGIEHMTGVGIATTRSEEGKKAIAAMGFCKTAYPPILEQALPCIAAGHKNSLLYQWMDPTYFDEMIARLVKNHTFLNPTLDFEWGGIIGRSPQFEAEDEKLLSNSNLQYVPYDERLVFLDQYHWAQNRTPKERAEFLKGYKNVQEFLRKFVAAGGKLYSGTDSASANVPGLAIHHEMQLYVDAGIPAMQALQSSTLWPAQMARMDKTLGSVEPGKFADVVVLNADPLKDIHNTERVEQVIKGGVVQDVGYHADYDVPFHAYGPVTKHLYNLPPVVSNLSPGVVVEGSDKWVTVTGQNFSPNSVVLFNGTAVQTKWVSDTQLLARLTPQKTATPGNYLVQVSTPKPGGGVSPPNLAIVVDYK
jgi:Amidohydrolase family/IPT/TIG domain